MKNAQLWLSLIVVLVVAVLLLTKKSEKPLADGPQTQLPPSEATLAGPQEQIPMDKYAPTAPLSKNKVILKNSMKIEITKEGAGEEIKNGQIAVVDYVGMLENGTVFDASKNHGDGSFSFQLGAGMVIKGWEEGVLGMKEGESRTLTIPPELGYGPNGVPPIIPANATLIFNITLLGIK